MSLKEGPIYKHEVLAGAGGELVGGAFVEKQREKTVGFPSKIP